MTKNKVETVLWDTLYVLPGLPRTGTASTYTALEKLLPGHCHHMFRAKFCKNDPPFWSKASRGELCDEDWRNFITYDMNSDLVLSF